MTEQRLSTLESSLDSLRNTFITIQDDLGTLRNEIKAAMGIIERNDLGIKEIVGQAEKRVTQNDLDYRRGIDNISDGLANTIARIAAMEQTMTATGQDILQARIVAVEQLLGNLVGITNDDVTSLRMLTGAFGGLTTEQVKAMVAGTSGIQQQIQQMGERIKTAEENGNRGGGYYYRPIMDSKCWEPVGMLKMTRQSTGIGGLS